MSEKPWHFPSIDLESKFNDSAMKLLLDQAEKHIKQQIDTQNRLVDKGYQLLGILLPGMSVLIAFLVNQLTSNQRVNWFLVCIVISLLAAGTVCIVLLVRASFVKKITYLGDEPARIATYEIMSHALAYQILLKDAIEEAQSKIISYDALIAHRAKLIRKVVIALSILFPLGVSIVLAYFLRP